MRKLFNLGLSTARKSAPSTTGSTSKQQTPGWRLLRFRPTGRTIFAGTAYHHHAHVPYKKPMSTSATTPADPPVKDPNMKPISALFLLFPNFNTLDLNGPLETLAQANGYNSFNTTIASATEFTTAAESLIVKRHIDFAQAHKSLPEYDILIIPGARNNDLLAALETQDDLISIVSEYSKLKTPSKSPSDLNINTVANSKTKERILLSICTGAGFLAKAGVLAGKKATTHWAFLEDLKQISGNYTKDHGTKATEVVTARFVDAGLNSNGVRIISSAGVSAGLDASLYLVSKKVGNDTANLSAHIMDYSWRLAEGLITDAGSKPKN